jgi:hypothetical protein
VVAVWVVPEARVSSTGAVETIIKFDTPGFLFR